MNAYDTETIASMMSKRGYEKVQDPSSADVVVVNTCSVREHAETRAINRLQELSRKKSRLLVVCGCMAQRMKNEIWNEVPGIDIIAGTDSYLSLPEMIDEALGRGYKQVDTEMNHTVTYSLEADVYRSNRVSRYISITRGCDNYCTYCIVPYVRGHERSKSPDDILKELDLIASSGAKEITLLGQNVSSYNYEGLNFLGLLKFVLKRTEFARIRFLTTHPKDVDMGIFELMARDERLCHHLHLPFQAGSDRILSLMKRGYTGDQYRRIIKQARSIVPDLALSTDIIVGFPTEREDDFLKTIEMVEEMRFDSAFTFKYSPREGTVAARMEDDVPEEVKKERLAVLNDKVQRIRGEILGSQLGKTDQILLDGEVKKGEYHFLKGRTSHFRNVLVDRAEGMFVGDIVEARLSELRGFTFHGVVTRR